MLRYFRRRHSMLLMDRWLMRSFCHVQRVFPRSCSSLCRKLWSPTVLSFASHTNFPARAVHNKRYSCMTHDQQPISFSQVSPCMRYDTVSKREVYKCIVQPWLNRPTVRNCMPSNFSVLLCIVLLTAWSRVLEQLTANRLVKQFLTLDLTLFPLVRCHFEEPHTGCAHD